MRHDALTRAVETMDGKDVLCSYSGGKDSRIVLDLAKRVARRVECFAMELVPELEVFESALQWAERRYGVTIRRYPHWLRAVYAREGVFCFGRFDAPRLDINDIYAVARNDAGIELVVTGAKRGDSLWRRRTGAIKFAGDKVKAPLWDWSSRDVAAYRAVHNLGDAVTDGRRASGIDLSEECVRMLHEQYPGDYAKLERAFPFIGAIVRRRQWYGAEFAKAASGEGGAAA